MYATFLADGRGILDRVGLNKGLAAVEEQIAVAPAGPGKRLMFFPKQIKFFADENSWHDRCQTPIGRVALIA
jgi:hypothetical protein